MALLKEFSADKLRVKLFSSRDEMGQSAARDAAECFRKLLDRQSEVNAVFAAAPSQNETLAYLAREKGIDWARVNAFHMDEYAGLKRSAPQSFGRYLDEHVFSLLPFKSVNYIDGGAPDIEKECARYAALLKEHPTDIVLLGIGENGHIAFNDPDEADFDDPKAVKTVHLDDVCRNQQVNDGCFAHIREVPKCAITLTIPTLFRAKHLFCSVPAATKADAVKKTVCGEITARVPATVMRRHEDATLYLDPDSGKELL